VKIHQRAVERKQANQRGEGFFRSLHTSRFSHIQTRWSHTGSHRHSQSRTEAQRSHTGTRTQSHRGTDLTHTGTHGHAHSHTQAHTGMHTVTYRYAFQELAHLKVRFIKKVKPLLDI
jgi:hypothetical protein